MNPTFGMQNQPPNQQPYKQQPSQPPKDSINVLFINPLKLLCSLPNWKAAFLSSIVLSVITTFIVFKIYASLSDKIVAPFACYALLSMPQFFVLHLFMLSKTLPHSYSVIAYFSLLVVAVSIEAFKVEFIPEEEPLAAGDITNLWKLSKDDEYQRWSIKCLIETLNDSGWGDAKIDGQYEIEVIKDKVVPAYYKSFKNKKHNNGRLKIGTRVFDGNQTYAKTFFKKYPKLILTLEERHIRDLCFLFIRLQTFFDLEIEVQKIAEAVSNGNEIAKKFLDIHAEFMQTVPRIPPNYSFKYVLNNNLLSIDDINELTEQCNNFIREVLLAMNSFRFNR